MKCVNMTKEIVHILPRLPNCVPYWYCHIILEFFVTLRCILVSSDVQSEKLHGHNYQFLYIPIFLQ